MDTIFMNSENTKTSEPHVLILTDILSIMIINKNQGPCIGLFQINHLVVYSKKIISIKTFNSEFQANEVCGLQIKIVNHEK